MFAAASMASAFRFRGKGKGFHSIAQGFFRIENADSHDSRIANSGERGIKDY